MSSTRFKFRLTRRRLVWLWAATGIILPLLYPVWILMRGPRAVPVSKETTFLTKPVLENGYVDYADGVNQLLTAGFADAESLDTHTVISAVQELSIILDKAKRTSNGRRPNAVFAPEVPARLREIAHLLNGPASLNLAPATHQQAVSAVGERFSGYRDFALSITRLDIELASPLREQVLAAIWEQEIGSAMDVIDAWNAVLQSLRHHRLRYLGRNFHTPLSVFDTLVGYRDIDQQRMRRQLTTMALPDYADLQRNLRLWRLSCLTELVEFHGAYNKPGFPGPSVARFFRTIGWRWTLARADWTLLFRHVNQVFDTGEAHLAMTFGRATQKPMEPAITLPPRGSGTPWSEDRATGYIDVLDAGGSTETIKVWAERHLENQRHRELLNAASYVFEYYFTHNRMPKHLDETGYGAKSRIPVDSPVAEELVELRSVKLRSWFPAKFHLAIGSGEDERQLRFFNDGRWAADFVDPE